MSVTRSFRRLEPSVVLAAALAVSCGEGTQNYGHMEPAGPAFDEQARELATRSSPVAPPHLMLDIPLNMVVNNQKTVLETAIVYSDGASLKAAVSSSAALTCEVTSLPKASNSAEATLDPSPKGDFYAGRAVSVPLIITIPDDNPTWREIHPSSSRVEIAAFTDADETVEVRFDARRALSKGNNSVWPFTLGGRIKAKICPSARALERRPPVTPDGFVHVEVGDQSFDVKSAIAFSADEAKNGVSIVSLSLYEESYTACDAALRAISDNGGGVLGLQVEIGPIGIGAGQKVLGLPHPVSADVTDVITGNVYFSQRYLTKNPTRGFIQVGNVDLKDEGGTLYGWIHVASEKGQHVLISGLVAAKICKRT